MKKEKLYQPMRSYVLYDFLIVSCLDPSKIVGSGYCASKYLSMVVSDMLAIGNRVMIINVTKASFQYFYVHMSSK